MTHVMLDIETWGKRPGCDIRSIGAVVFDPVAGHVTDDTFYIATDNAVLGDRAKGWVETLGFTPNVNDPCYDIHGEYYRKYPLTRDPETVKWWSDQSLEAQSAFENPVDLRDGLRQFGKWLCQVSADKIWANDPHFDVSILDAAYHAVGLPTPWHYRAPRSMKTATDLAGLPRSEYSEATVEHHALYDAIAQAETVCKCYERLGLRV